MTKIKDDNLPVIVAVVSGLVFIAVSITLVVTVGVSTPEQADAAQDQTAASSTGGFFAAFNYDIVPDNQPTNNGTTTDTSKQATNDNNITDNDEVAQQQDREADRRADAKSNEDQESVSTDQPATEPETGTQSFTNYRELESEIEEEDAGFQDRLSNRDRLFGGEAIITDFEFTGWSNLREQETDDVADISFRPEKSDLLVNRVDISFVHTGEDGDDEPWEVFKQVSIKSDRETLASVSADDQADWLDDGSDYDGSLEGSEQFAMRLNELDKIIDRNDTADLSVHLTVQDSIDDAGETSWGVFVDDAGVRAVDAIDVQHRFGDSADTVEFRINESSDRQDDPEVVVDESYHNPDGSVIPVNQAGLSGPFSVFAFDIDARDTDTSLERIQLQMELKGVSADSDKLVGYNDVINQAAITVDEQVYTVDTIRSVTSRHGTTKFVLTFELEEDIFVEEYDSKTAKLLVQLRGTQNNYADGLLLRGSVSAGGVVSENGLKNQNGVAGSWHIVRSE